MGRKGSDAMDLMNFHFFAPAQQQQRRQNGSSGNGNNRNRNSNSSSNNRYDGRNGGNRKQQQRYNRTSQDRASARKKANSAMFYLHSSADHTFVITRKTPGKVTQQQPYSFSGPDAPVSWSAVRLVKHLAAVAPVPVKGCDEDTVEQCPVCLDSFTCSRITKCGHIFCLPCLLRHVQSAQANNPYQHVKCPCCGLPVIVDDLRPVQIMRTVPPVVQKNFRLRKIHRTKECPAPYLPQPDQKKHSNPHSAPISTDSDAAFCRFTYVEPTSYQAHLVANQGEVEREMKQLQAVLNANRANPNNPHVHSLQVELVCHSMAMEIVLKEQRRAREELEEETKLAERYASPSSGMYQMQSPGLAYTNTEEGCDDLFSVEDGGGGSITAEGADGADLSEFHVDGDDRKQKAELIGDSFQDLSLSTSPLPTESLLHSGIPSSPARRHRGNSIGSYVSVGSNASSQQSKKPFSPRSTKLRHRVAMSMYLEEEAVHMYQSEDGQLVFLNGFNLACLSSDYSKNPPSDEESTSLDVQPRPPFPDYVEGTVLEIESVHLTPDVRKRMPFLSHLPLYTDVSFVELNLNRYLSDATRHKFQADMNKRHKKRQTKAQAERRADRLAKQLEQEQIEERKARMQRIDPNDDFFQVVVPPPEPAVVATADDAEANVAPAAVVASSPSAVASFSQACQTGNRLVVSANEAFPSLGSSVSSPPPPPTRQPQWGKRPSWQPPTPAVAATPAPAPVAAPKPGGKKKKGGKKQTLFSTGGQRGSAY